MKFRISQFFKIPYCTVGKPIMIGIVGWKAFHDDIACRGISFLDLYAGHSVPQSFLPGLLAARGAQLRLHPLMQQPSETQRFPMVSAWIPIGSLC